MKSYILKKSAIFENKELKNEDEGDGNEGHNCGDCSIGNVA